MNSQEPIVASSRSDPAGILLFHVKRTYSNLIAFALSVFFHCILFLILLYIIKQKPTKLLTTDVEDSSPMRVTLNPPQELETEQKKPKTEPRILTTEGQTPFAVPSTPVEPSIESEKFRNLERFLPRSSSEYLQKLRNQAANPPEITGDSGDIPIRGTDRRRDIPMIVDRFEHKEMSLFQFTQMFRDRFGAIWNSEERWVPPESSLKPGDVIYYKIFINPDGTLEHFENLTNKVKPTLITDDLDKIFAKVIAQTLPMILPAKLEKNILVTQVLAIQVVDKTLFMNFGK